MLDARRRTNHDSYYLLRGIFADNYPCTCTCTCSQASMQRRLSLNRGRAPSPPVQLLLARVLQQLVAFQSVSLAFAKTARGLHAGERLERSLAADSLIAHMAQAGEQQGESAKQTKLKEATRYHPLLRYGHTQCSFGQVPNL